MDTIEQNVTEKRVFENGRIFVAPMGAKDVVTIKGSVLGGSNMLPKEQVEVPAVGARLLDAGTKKHSKDALRTSLATRGASLRFHSGGDRTHFSGSCLPEDLPFLLQLTAECLGSATFAQAEIANVRERLLGNLKESRTDTRGVASNELARMLYDTSHDNYVYTIDQYEKSAKDVTRPQLSAFKNLLGRGGLVLAITGDVDPSKAIRAAENAFKVLPEGTGDAPIKYRNKKIPSPHEKRTLIAGKANIDVYFGVAVPLTYDDELYLPLDTVTDMLGGSFAAHLMQTVRERDGLTYGIRAMTSGFGKNIEGSFRIWSTFSPDLYRKGIDSIRKEVTWFFKNGITTEILEKKKVEMIGSYVIGLSTTEGLAGQLHAIGVRDQELSFIDTWKDRVRAVTVSDLSDAAALIPLEKLSLSAAGTFLK